MTHDPSGLLTAALWLGTYLLHSTCLLGAAWVVAAAFGRRRERDQEIIWKLAVLVPILSATIQVVADIAPAAGTLDVGSHAFDESTAIAVDRPAITASNLPAPSRPRGIEEPLAADAVADRAASLMPRSESGDTAASPGIDGSSAAPVGTGWARLPLVAILVAIAVMFLLALRAWLRLERNLGDRRPITAGPLPDMLGELTSRRWVRLSRSARLEVPIAMGILRPEICVPEDVESRLTPRQQRSMLAHELAHHEGRDPAWFAVLHVVEHLLFLQPLNRVAAHHLRRLAEYRCDARAAERVGDGLVVASCLAEVARWLAEGNRPSRAGAVAMAGRASLLRRRVGRLLDEPPSSPRPGELRWTWFRWVSAPPVLLAGLVLVAPGVSAAPDVAPRPAVADPTFAHPPATLPVLSADPSAPPAPESAVSRALALLDEDVTRLADEIAVLRRSAMLGGPDRFMDAALAELERRAGEIRHRGDRLRRTNETRNTPTGISRSTQ